MKKMVVLVNNEYSEDPRVYRCVTSSKNYFDNITILSGAPIWGRKNYTEENVTVYRHFYYKPNFSNSKLIKMWVSIAMAPNRFRKKNNNEEPRDHVTRSPSGIIQLFRIGIFLFWYFYILLMNLWLFFKYLGIKADVYYSNDYDTLLAAYLLAKLHRGKIIYDTHELYVDMLENSPKIYVKLLKWQESFLSRRTDTIITVNVPIAQTLKERYQLKKQPVVIYNCPFYQEVLPINRPDELPIKILYHGRYLAGRNLDVVIQSMQYVQNCHLYLRGDGVYEQHMRDLVAELGLKDKITFLDSIKMLDLVTEAVNFDVGIIPFPIDKSMLNIYYNTPNKTFEYMMAGLALAVSDIPVLREIVSTHHLGVIFEKSNPTQIAETLNNLSLENIREYKKNSLIAAREIYNYNQESRKLVEVYNHIFNGC